MVIEVRWRFAILFVGIFIGMFLGAVYVLKGSLGIWLAGMIISYVAALFANLSSIQRRYPA